MQEQQTARHQTVEKIIKLLPIVRHVMSMEGMLGRGEMLSSAQFSVLSILWDQGPMSMSTLAHRIGSSKPNLTMLVDRMQKAGMVQRQPSQEDRRVTFIRLTPAAEDYLKDAVKTLVGTFERRMDRLDAQEVERLTQALDTMMELMPKVLE